jgi:hypothetical protein
VEPADPAPSGAPLGSTDEPVRTVLNGLTFQLSPHLTQEQADEAEYWVTLSGGRLVTSRAGREEAVGALATLAPSAEPCDTPGS